MTAYRTIVADPPWDIAWKGNESIRMGGGKLRPSKIHELPYKTMSLDDILAIDVPADPDSLLFLWATRKVFRDGDAARVARAWGFKPCGEVIWGLRNPGLGGALGNDHEPVLIARRGSEDRKRSPGRCCVLAAAVRTEREDPQRQAGRVHGLGGVYFAGAIPGDVRSPPAARLGHVGQRGFGPCGVGGCVTAAPHTRREPREVECGSDEELELRGVWLSRLMFGGFVDMVEHRSYQQWLAAQGLRLA